MKLFYIILGATPKGRNIEQHDVFFGIGESLKDLIPAMKTFWPEAKGKIHIDCYQEVKFADGFEVKIVEKDSKVSIKSSSLAQSTRDAKKAAIEAEAKVNETRAAELAKKKEDERKAVEAAAREAEAEVVAQSAPAEEAPAAEATETTEA